MAIRVRHFDNKFADDQTDPAQLNCPGSQARYGFLGFFSEKKVFVTSHFLALLKK